MLKEDRYIIQLYLDRDETAINATSYKYEKYCKSIANSILSNWEDVEECINDVYLKTWNAIPPNIPISLKAFLGRITRNQAFDIYKKNTAYKRGNGQLSLVLDELAECIICKNSPKEELDKKELINIINSFLKKLPKKKRILFVNRYWYGYSITEISDRLNMSENDVSVSLLRLRKKLNQYLIERGYTL